MSLETLSETVQIFEHARGKIPMEVMIEHTDAFDWTVVTKVADIIDICAIGGRIFILSYNITIYIDSI
jgi:hypothetical protein